ncbi:AAA family ATPase [Haladaptatus caseinilyticus]|uniref:AAA family ATPase n=1 Tax=Haladaptatus caseinilyticus TaxID=2993314 RepID=UPI0038994775
MGQQLLVTLSGSPDSGTSTLSEMLANECGISIVNGGDIFREMAQNQEMTVAEFATGAEDCRSD